MSRRCWWKTLRLGQDWRKCYPVMPISVLSPRHSHNQEPLTDITCLAGLCPPYHPFPFPTAAPLSQHFRPVPIMLYPHRPILLQFVFVAAQTIPNKCLFSSQFCWSAIRTGPSWAPSCICCWWQDGFAFDNRAFTNLGPQLEQMSWLD